MVDAAAGYGPTAPAESSPESSPELDPELDPDSDGDASPRCWRCNRKLAEWVSRPWKIMCTRCKAVNTGVVTH